MGTEPTLGALRACTECSTEELERMGRNGRKLIEEKYSTQAEAEGMLRMYEKLLK